MARFHANPGFEAEMKAEPRFLKGMHDIATGVEHHVEHAAPRGSGYYIRHVEAEGTIVGTTDPFGHIVEWGSVNNPPYGPLRRGVIAAGLRLDETPR